MKTRILSGLLLLIIVVPVFILWHTAVYEIFFAVLAVLAVYEILHCTGFSKNLFFLIPCGVIAAFLPFLASDESLLSRIISESNGARFTGRYFYIMVILLFYMMTVSMFSKGKYSLKDTAVSFMMVFYVLFGLSALVAIRDYKSPDGNYLGIYLVILVFVASWLTDTGAYFVGVLFGKHKLIPDISPKKTVEGAIGGIAVAIGACILYSFIISKVAHSGHNPNFGFVAIAAFAMSVISQIGDLLASNVKRTYDVKDFGHILPGHGGVVDRMDSVVAASTILYILCTSTSFKGMII